MLGKLARDVGTKTVWLKLETEEEYVMANEGEHSMRQAFISWAVNQAQPAALVLPEVSVSGKKIDLVCVEGPLDVASLGGQGRGSQLVKRYQIETWLKHHEQFKPEGVRRLGLDKHRMDGVARHLEGKRVWVVELKNSLTSEALGQILVYRHHFMKN